MTLEVTLRLFVALLLGGIVGIEREFRSKDAGFRTHFLVALGSALFCVVSQYGFGIDLKDSSRVAASRESDSSALEPSSFRKIWYADLRQQQDCG